MKRLYFLGIGGTLMGHLAVLARELGFEVSGSDGAVYPPMSDVLADAGIEVHEGFDPVQLEPAPDLVVIGNAGLPRGHPGVEHVLDAGLPYTSGAEWLGRAVLRDRWVLAVAGTHGKTTTAAMLTHILEHGGLDPGYLIGGVPNDLARSARLGRQPFFVVEADEYDTSYFDRRSKFVHYRPRTLIVNNLEYDHADIFADLDAIQTQFHHLMRTVPASGLIIAPEHDDAVDHVLRRGCWTPVSRVRAGDAHQRGHRGAGELETNELWRAVDASADGGSFTVARGEVPIGEVRWSVIGTHNVANALAAIAAASHAGVLPELAIEALNEFTGVRRRLELIKERGGVRVYDDFAHHPTAIRTTLEALRHASPRDEIIAVIEPRSHTMSLGTLHGDLARCCAAADQVIWFRGENIKWDLAELTQTSVIPARMASDIDALVRELAAMPAPKRGRHIVIMSNGGFGGIHAKLASALDG